MYSKPKKTKKQKKTINEDTTEKILGKQQCCKLMWFGVPLTKQRLKKVVQSLENFSGHGGCCVQCGRQCGATEGSEWESAHKFEWKETIGPGQGA